MMRIRVNNGYFDEKIKKSMIRLENDNFEIFRNSGSA